MTGSIAGVGNYINGYGESIKRSMSSDGPVSTQQKKTAVKPPGAVDKGSSQGQKALPQAQKAAGGAKQQASSAAGGGSKALSSVGGAAKGVGAGAQKTASSATRSASQASRPAQQATKGVANGVSKTPPANARNATSGSKPATGPASNTRSQQPSNKVQNRSTNGKVSISAASRPKPGPAKSTKPPVKGVDGKKHDASDPLGMGGIVDEKGKKGGSGNKSTKAQPQQGKDGWRKPSAADPLGMGGIVDDKGKK